MSKTGTAAMILAVAIAWFLWPQNISPAPTVRAGTTAVPEASAHPSRDR